MTTNHRIKHSSQRSVFIHPNDMAEQAAPQDFYTLCNVHVIEEVIQLLVGSDTVVIANSYWTKNLVHELLFTELNLLILQQFYEH